MTTAKRWSFSAGARHRNRVRALEAPTGLLFIEYRERTEGRGVARRIRQSLGHRYRTLAVRQVKSIAAKLVAVSGLQHEISLRSLFDIYVREVTPRKGANKQHHDRGTADMFLQFFGADRPAILLNLRDWEGFVDARRGGEIGPGDQRRLARERHIDDDLRSLRAGVRWCTTAGRGG